MLSIRHFILWFLLCFALAAGAQDFPYTLNPEREIAMLTAAGSLSMTSHTLENKLDGHSPTEVATLQRKSVWFVDRGATRHRSEVFRNISDEVLRGSMLLPGTLLFSKPARRKGLVLATLLAETMLANDGLTKASKIIVQRSRPYIYNRSVDIDAKRGEDSRQSFVSGHTSNTAALTFFTAKVFHDLYPDSPWRPVVWAGAATIPLVTGYARYRAGKHFPTDIAAGYALGAALGILVPQLHKRGGEHWSMTATADGLGIAYRF
ncbi:phosphatase PAP2 family protein [Lewinella sp. IMCC34191]|uniref:phosphatase PAP2 family protein n=1 Tax=Lewinella sp. IMCC34191 TaxID=2259172 RepID=UPI00130098D6|nr:phosphatase PAP2 family protein [Lewinella sp. IMCC34191]